jgi:hypothetical protein
MLPRLDWNSPFSQLSLLSAGITSLHHHTLRARQWEWRTTPAHTQAADWEPKAGRVAKKGCGGCHRRSSGMQGQHPTRLLGRDWGALE